VGISSLFKRTVDIAEERNRRRNQREACRQCCPWRLHRGEAVSSKSGYRTEGDRLFKSGSRLRFLPPRSDRTSEGRPSRNPRVRPAFYRSSKVFQERHRASGADVVGPGCFHDSPLRDRPRSQSERIKEKRSLGVDSGYRESFHVARSSTGRESDGPDSEHEDQRHRCQENDSSPDFRVACVDHSTFSFLPPLSKAIRLLLTHSFTPPAADACNRNP